MNEKNRIGERLKTRRKAEGLSIQVLSERSGVSTGQISQIEQGKVIPSVICLYNLAATLHTDLNYFFQVEPGVVVQKEGERKIVVTNEGRSRYEILSPSRTRDHKVEMLKIELKAHSVYEGKNTGISHEGEECGYILSGAMIVHIDGEDIRVGAGESIYFPSKKYHYFENPFDEDCISVWGMTPLFF